MDTLKQKVIEYGDNRIEYMKEQNQEIADRMTKQVLGMSGVMAQEMKVVSANEYSASEAYTLRKVADKRKDSDEGVLEELHRRLNFYYKRMKMNGDDTPRQDNGAYEERGKGRSRGIEETYQSLKAFMMRMTDQGILQKVDGSKHEYELQNTTV